jgi:hypothetical protein
MPNEVTVEPTPTSIPMQAPHITPKLARHEANDREVPATVSERRRVPVSSDSLSQRSAIIEVAASDTTSANGAKTGSTDIESVAVPPPTPGGEAAEEPKVSEEERVTTSEIISLWAEHNEQNASLKKSSKELKETRTRLGAYLYQLKNLLAKTGRNGRWTSFLNGEGIPRATADRYVESHKRFLDRKNGKRLTEAISVPTEGEIKEMVAKLTPRLVRVLTTPESITKFLREMAAALHPSVSAA